MIQSLCNRDLRLVLWVDKRYICNISTSYMGSRRQLRKGHLVQLASGLFFPTLTFYRADLPVSNVRHIQSQPTAGKWTVLMLQNCSSQHLMAG